MKRTLVYVLLLCFTFTAAYWFIFDTKLDTNGDNANYIELAHSLADGKGYTQFSLHGDYSPANQFPPGYPFILSLLIRAGIDNLISFKILNGLFLLASILLLFFTVRGMTGSGFFAFSTALISLISYKELEFSTIVMSEMSYMFFCTVTLLSLWRLSNKDNSHANVWFLTAILSAAAAYYIRGTGLAIIFAVVVFFIFRKEWIKAAVSSAASLLLILPWSIRARILGFKSRYMSLMLANNAWRPEEGSVNSLSSFLSKTKINFDDCILRGFREVIFPGWEIDGDILLWEIAVGMVILILVFYGLWSMKPLRFALTGFLAANIVIIITWHTDNHLRYVVPFIPVVISGFWNGILSLAVLPFRKSRFRCITRRTICAMILLLFIPSILQIAYLRKYAQEDYIASFKEYFDCSQWIQNQNIDPLIARELTVVCRKPSLTHYCAGDYFCMTYPFTQDREEMLKSFVDNNVRYIIVDNFEYYSTVSYLIPTIELFKHLCKEVYACGDTKVLVFDKLRATVNLEFIREIKADQSKDGEN